VHELRGEAEPALAALLGKLAPVDLVLIEGYKREPHPKLEVHRAAVGRPLLAPSDTAIVAIASDVAVPSAPVPVLDLNDIEGIVEVLIRRAVPLDAALAPAGVG
jgi:molybdopterin-guanine dinucleotide biosynthesis adapter protein